MLNEALLNSKENSPIMNGDKLERRSIELTLDEWKMLESMAELTRSLTKAGPRAGSSSWRTLIRRLADGDFILQSTDSALNSYKSSVTNGRVSKSDNASIEI
jgi:hypothetical protein